MKKIDLGQTVTIFANIGVIAGIVFLGFEIRQNTMAVKSEASIGVQSQIQSIYNMLLVDPMMDIYMRGMENPADLDPLEAAKLNAFLSTNLAAFQNIYTQVQEGSYDESLARGYWQLLRNLLEMPGMKEYWATRSYVMSDEFRLFVETDVMRLAPMEGTTILSGTE